MLLRRLVEVEVWAAESRYTMMDMVKFIMIILDKFMNV